jgi:acetyl esterase/lipase
MVGSELAPWWLAVLVLMTAVFALAGCVGGWAGRAGLVVAAGSSVGFLVAMARSRGAGRVVAAAITDVAGGGFELSRIGFASLVPLRSSRSRFEVTLGMGYGPHPAHLVDRIARRDLVAPGPAIIHLHGGGWWRGRRHRQGLPLLHRMADEGWIAFTADYRLSPEVTIPDQVADVKRLIAWIRANAVGLGVDPAFIAVAGGSAGGHLAALAALTPANSVAQPGLEDSDASIQACLPLYGVHDLLDGSGAPLWPYLVDQVVGVDPAADPEAWRQVSPTRMATADHPPFLVVHGAADTLVDPALSRDLVGALRAAGGAPVGYLEVPWANHGFDYFRSPRSVRVVDGAARFLVATFRSRTVEEAG